MLKVKKLQDEAQQVVEAARAIAQKADDERRGLTAAERAEFDQHMAKGRDLVAAIKNARTDEQVLKAASDLAREIDGPGRPGGSGLVSGRKSVSRWASSTADTLIKAAAGRSGQKALVSGSYGVPSAIRTDGTLPQRPTSILDLINRQADPAGLDGRTGNEFSYLRQTTRTNNAAVVADGGTKPTSVYTVTEISDKYRVIAHLSEEIPLRYFADNSNLETWLQDEMEYGLMLAVEDQVINGGGVIAQGQQGGPLDEIAGILEVATGSQAWATDLFKTTRKAKTTLVNSGQAPTAYVFSPGDSELLDLAQDQSKQFYGAGPFAAGPETLWGIPRISSPTVTDGTAILGDWTQATLLVREESTLAVDTGGDLFEENKARLRLEGRFGLAIHRPAAFVVVATASS